MLSPRAFIQASQAGVGGSDVAEGGQNVDIDGKVVVVAVGGVDSVVDFGGKVVVIDYGGVDVVGGIVEVEFGAGAADVGPAPRVRPVFVPVAAMKVLPGRIVTTTPPIVSTVLAAIVGIERTLPSIVTRPEITG